MEEDKLKDIFTGYSPELSPDNMFMSRLEKNLHSVEVIKQRCASTRNRNRAAITIAAVTGFICGVVSTLLYPYLSALVKNLGAMSFIPVHITDAYGDIMLWAIIGITTCLITFTAYDITSGIFNHGHARGASAS